jgi:hypothetical protein
MAACERARLGRLQTQPSFENVCLAWRVHGSVCTHGIHAEAVLCFSVDYAIDSRRSARSAHRLKPCRSNSDEHGCMHQSSHWLVPCASIDKANHTCNHPPLTYHMLSHTLGAHHLGPCRRRASQLVSLEASTRRSCWSTGDKCLPVVCRSVPLLFSQACIAPMPAHPLLSKGGNDGGLTLTYTLT